MNEIDTKRPDAAIRGRKRERVLPPTDGSKPMFYRLSVGLLVVAWK